MKKKKLLELVDDLGYSIPLTTASKPEIILFGKGEGGSDLRIEVPHAFAEWALDLRLAAHG